MVAVEDGGDGVVVVDTRRGVAVVEERVGAVPECLIGLGIIAWLRGIEVHQLHHRLGVLQRGTTGDAARTGANGGRHTHATTVQNLAQLQGIPLAYAAVGHGTRQQREVVDILVAKEAGATIGTHLQLHHITTKVGLAHIHLHAVGERQLREAVHPRLLADDGAGHRLLSQQLSTQLLLLDRCILLALSGQDNILNLLFGGQGHGFLVRSIHKDHLILVADELMHVLIHLVEGHLALKLLRQLPLGIR